MRRRNRRGPGAVICFSGPSGVGKTSLAQCVAEALRRGFVKLACGGLRDEPDLRGHNRTWKGAQPGAILRELRRVGSKDPVFVLDEIDKLGPDPAAVLLEVLDPAQHHRFCRHWRPHAGNPTNMVCGLIRQQTATTQPRASSSTSCGRSLRATPWYSQRRAASDARCTRTSRPSRPGNDHRRTPSGRAGPSPGPTDSARPPAASHGRGPDKPATAS